MPRGCQSTRSIRNSVCCRSCTQLVRVQAFDLTIATRLKLTRCGGRRIPLDPRSQRPCAGDPTNNPMPHSGYRERTGLLSQSTGLGTRAHGECAGNKARHRSRAFSSLVSVACQGTFRRDTPGGCCPQWRLTNLSCQHLPTASLSGNPDVLVNVRLRVFARASRRRTSCRRLVRKRSRGGDAGQGQSISSRFGGGSRAYSARGLLEKF